MRRRDSRTTVPDELQTYDAAHWAPLAAKGERGGSLAYYRALRGAGVHDDIAHRLRAAAFVREAQGRIGWTGPAYPWPLDAEGSVVGCLR